MSPLLQALARDDDLVDVINEKGPSNRRGGAHLDEDTRGILRETFPNAKVRNIYPSTMILGGAKIAFGILNRADQRSAFDLEQSAATLAAWDRIKANPDILVAIITGKGQAFSAGADLKKLIPHILGSKR